MAMLLIALLISCASAFDWCPGEPDACNIIGGSASGPGFEFPTFSPAPPSTELSLHGCAIFDNGVLQLTPPELAQSGSATWLQPLTATTGFSTSFSFELTEPGPENGADYVLFSINHDKGDPVKTTGPGVLQAIIDTYYNTVPWEDGHIQIKIDDILYGNAYCVSLGTTQHSFELLYDEANSSLVAKLDGTPIITASVNLTNVWSTYIPDEVYLLLRSATGGQYQRHRILSWFWESAWGDPETHCVLDCYDEYRYVINGADTVSHLPIDTFDACMVCGGSDIGSCPTCPSGVFDVCGVCDGGNSSCQDCAGIPNGPNEEDVEGTCCIASLWDGCGVCNGGSALAPLPFFEHCGFAKDRDAISLLQTANFVDYYLQVNPSEMSVVGHAWKSEKIDPVRGFTNEVSFQFISGTPDGADHLSFIVQHDGPTATTVNSATSFTVRVDTYYNFGVDLCPSHDARLLLIFEGVLLASYCSEPLEGSVHELVWSYDPLATLTTVTLDSTLIMSATVDLSTDSVWNQEAPAYIGFAGSTGGKWETHDVIAWRFSSPPLVCAKDCNGEYDRLVLLGQQPTPVFDYCNVCGGDNTTCRDCTGLFFGTEAYDNCGVCGGDDTSCCGSRGYKQASGECVCMEHYYGSACGEHSGGSQAGSVLSAPGKITVRGALHLSDDTTLRLPRMDPLVERPTCQEESRGVLWMSSGESDQLFICIKFPNGTMGWMDMLS